MRRRLKKITFIYVLSDSSAKGAKRIRYVGKTVRPLKARFVQHVWCAKAGAEGHVGRWLRKIGFKAEIRLIEAVPADKSWEKAEKKWIKYYKSKGCRLTNITEGGEGMPGWVPSKRTREKWRRRIFTPLWRARLSAANSGRRHSKKQNMEQSRRMRGRRDSITTRRLKSVNNPRYWLGKIGPCLGRPSPLRGKPSPLRGRPSPLAGVPWSVKRRMAQRKDREKRTHCPNGHPYAGINLAVRKNGSRVCQECHRQQGREFYKRSMKRNANAKEQGRLKKALDTGSEADT
jgi:hypothetical protein